MLGLLSLLAPLVVLPTDWSESLPQASAFTSSGYEQIVTTPEVMVYKYKGSSTIRLGAEAKIAVSPQVLHDALVDYEGQVGMIGNLAHVKVLQRGAGWQLAYERIRMPVVSDRDFTVMVTWGKDGRGHWLRYWNDERAGIPKQKGVVRVPYHRGSWQLAPADGRAPDGDHEERLAVGHEPDPAPGYHGTGGDHPARGKPEEDGRAGLRGLGDGRGRAEREQGQGQRRAEAGGRALSAAGNAHTPRHGRSAGRSRIP